MTKHTDIPIIDLFAGPGGLGEGFSQLEDNKIRFKIALSIEMDKAAHSTLNLRAFYRQFDSPPKEYYQYLNGEITQEELFKHYPKESSDAANEAWHHELKMSDLDEVKARARKALSGFSSKEFVMIGGPPCQAYSIAGRARMQSTRENFDDDPRHYLYRHYLRLVAHLKPACFVMENVKGLTSAKVHGNPIFPQIMKELETPGQVVKELDNLARTPSNAEYHIYSLVKPEPEENQPPLQPSDYVINAEDYGIPQRRHRVILLGIRKDVDPKLPTRLKKAKDLISVSDVLDSLPALRSHVTGRLNTPEEWNQVMAEGLGKGEFDSVDTKTLAMIRKVVKIGYQQLETGSVRYLKQPGSSGKLNNWYRKNCRPLKVVLNHQSKRHMESDIWRYLFASCFAKVHGRPPYLGDYPDNLLPNHKNVDSESKKTAKFIDRFKVQLANIPATTVMSHISKDGHYYIHHDPSQCRAWTVREAARIQTFPDNYFFEGTRTEQYHQVGNAVPPRLAWQISNVVAANMKKILSL
ncbi:DNA cytosine methyltransferase [Microbulbifer sp. EKSA005]|uniref:DNA cytosine methyltransferase n=1 Tax=Microbulbifer sp. EKSA005 TaxID=3243364 RepID=UPI004041E8D2